MTITCKDHDLMATLTERVEPKDTNEEEEEDVEDSDNDNDDSRGRPDTSRESSPEDEERDKDDKAITMAALEALPPNREVTVYLPVVTKQPAAAGTTAAHRAAAALPKAPLPHLTEDERRLFGSRACPPLHALVSAVVKKEASAATILYDGPQRNIYTHPVAATVTTDSKRNKGGAAAVTVVRIPPSTTKEEEQPKSKSTSSNSTTCLEECVKAECMSDNDSIGKSTNTIIDTAIATPALAASTVAAAIDDCLLGE